jgi:hypothetical protein
MRILRAACFVVLVTAILVAACAPPVPRIASAELGTGTRAGKLEDPKNSFVRSERIIHLLVAVENALPSTTVGAKWYSVGASKRLLLESDVALDPLNTTADFALTSTNDWIPGSYQVVVYLDGKEARTLNFEVR